MKITVLFFNRIKRLKRLNVLQDVTAFCQRLASRLCYDCFLAFTRHKTLNISKSCRKPYKAFIILYTNSFKLNVLNVLLKERLTIKWLQRDVKKIANVLNVLFTNKYAYNPCHHYKTFYIKTNFIQL